MFFYFYTCDVSTTPCSLFYTCDVSTTPCSFTFTHVTFLPLHVCIHIFPSWERDDVVSSFLSSSFLLISSNSFIIFSSFRLRFEPSITQIDWIIIFQPIMFTHLVQECLVSQWGSSSPSHLRKPALSALPALQSLPINLILLPSPLLY